MRISRRIKLHIVLTVSAIVDAILALDILSRASNGDFSLLEVAIFVGLFLVAGVSFSLLNPEPYDSDKDER